MSFIINIGLAREGSTPVSVLHAVVALDTVGLTLHTDAAVYRSDTEDTLVLEVAVQGAFTPPAAPLRKLCKMLGQDCIAAYHVETKEGQLIGPKAAEWGPFNPEFFIMLDGSRLAQPAKKDRVSQIMAYEGGEMNEDEMIEFFQSMIDDGSVWQLQGSYGRTAAVLIERGLCSAQNPKQGA